MCFLLHENTCKNWKPYAKVLPSIGHYVNQFERYNSYGSTHVRRWSCVNISMVATDNSIYRVHIGFKFPVFRCTYDSRGRNTETRIGARSGDEMCNLYMMFFVEPGTASDFLVCSGEQVNDLFKFSVGIRRDINFSIRPDIRLFLCSLWGRGLRATSSFVQAFR